MKNLVRFVSLVVVCLILLPWYSVKAEPKTRTVEFIIGSGIPIINGEPSAPLELPIYIEKGRTMIAIRFLSEVFDISIKWDNDKKVASFKSKDILIEMPENEKIVKVNGKEVQTDVPFFINLIAHRMVVPVRFIMETFGATVSWDPDLHKATIVYEIPEA